MDRLLWYVFAGSRGGPTRTRIVRALLERPQNVNQLAVRLGLDYKTVEYNVRVLAKHVLVVRSVGAGYGTPCSPSKNLLAARQEFERIAAALNPAPSIGAPGRSTQPESGKT